MAGISRDYLGALLTVASRICGYLEGITPEQRTILERLSEVPQRQNRGWVRVDQFRRETAHIDLSGKEFYGLVRRGLVEQQNCEHIPHAHISQDGLDLLERIDRHMERDWFLQRFRSLQQSPVATCHEHVQKQSYADLSRRVIEALHDGPAKRETLVVKFGITVHQLDHALRRLKAAGTVWSDNGVYHLVRQEGAA